jgi:hypothetical protein
VWCAGLAYDQSDDVIWIIYDYLRSKRIARFRIDHNGDLSENGGTYVHTSTGDKTDTAVGVATGAGRTLFVAESPTTRINRVYYPDSGTYIEGFSTGANIHDVDCDSVALGYPVIWARHGLDNQIKAYEIDHSTFASDCADTSFPLGVCCLPDGSCIISTEDSCHIGLWIPELGQCLPDSSPCQLGACCFDDGTCEIMSYYECEILEEGTFKYNQPCSPELCPAEGVCCDSTDCYITSEAVCLDSGHVWHPEWPAVCDTPNVCSPPCTSPPRRLKAWWPFEEQTGVRAYDIANWINIDHNDSPTWLLDGHVGRAIRLDTASDYFVSSPTGSQELAIGTGDFSIDVWVRMRAGSTIRPIIDQRIVGVHAGFTLFLGEGNNVGFQLADAGGWTNFPTSTPIPDDDEWHHVAVTVNRDQTDGGKIYVDGAVVRTFDPTGRPGSVTNGGPFLIGTHRDSERVFNGDIDELQIFRRALQYDEVRAIFQAGETGKCKELCYLPRVVTKCEDESSTWTKLTICNYTGLTKTYTWFIWGAATGADCNMPGFAWMDPASETVQVGPGCETFTIKITPINYLPHGDRMCYKAHVFSETGEQFALGGVVKGVHSWHCPPTIGGEAIPAITDLTPIPLDEPITINFPLNNLSSDPDTLDYRIFPRPADMDTLRQIVSLNGLPAGEAISGSAITPPESSTVISVDAAMLDHDPFMVHDVVLAIDFNCDGELQELASSTLQSEIDAMTNVRNVPTPTPSVPLKLVVYPNPFNSTTEVVLDLPSSQVVEVVIFDVAGRQVRTLRNEILSSGGNSILWDARSDAGNVVASGLYFVKARTVNGTAAGKILLLK